MVLEITLAVLAAFVAGFIDAIAGGGGIITLPTLLWLGLSPASAVATNKLVNTCGATSAAYTFVRHKRYTREVVRLGLPLTALGALAGAFLVTRVSGEALKPFMAVVILLVALYFGLRHELGLRGTYAGLSRRLAILTAGCALALGFYDGFIGPGTGAFLMVLFVRGLGFDFVYAAGNTKILNWTSNIVALAFFLFGNEVQFAVGLPMMPANLLGGYLGAHFAIRKGSAWVRVIFLLMALVLAGRMVWKWYQK